MPAKQINEYGLDPDRAILDEKDDLLGRHPLAYRIADMINNLGDDYKHSVVIGIEGAWGAGKSSFINLILNKVRPSEKNLVVEFNPWNFSDQNELIKDFFNSITNALDKIYSRKSLTRRVYEKLSDRFKFYRLRRFCKQKFLAIPYLPELLPIDTLIKGLKLLLKVLLYPFRLLGVDIFIKGVMSLLRLVGIFILELFLVRRPPKSPSKQIKNYSSKLLKLGEISLAPTISILGIVNIRINALWESRYSDNDSLEDQRKEIDKFLNKLPRRLVIVIDDIDRLDTEETKLIFKLVKLTADFPNTIFLLAYDRYKVGERLGEGQSDIKGQEYLKKIVQQPFLIPKPAAEDIFYVLDVAISNELKRAGFDLLSRQHNRLEGLVNSNGFKKLFPTIREIRRYTNSLRLDLKLFDVESVNSADFVGIEAIRVFAPEVYLAMTNENPLFTGVFSTSKPYDKVRKDRIEKIVAVAPKGLEDSTREIIKRLFPQVEKLYSNGKKSTGSKWREWGVCYKETFHRYFSLSVPATGLSAHELYDFLSTAEKIDGLLEKWEVFFEQHKQWILLRKVCFPSDILDDRLLSNEQRKSVELSDQRIENILISLFNFVENMKNDQRRTIDLNRLVREVERTSYVMLEKIERENRAKHLENIINATTGFFIMADYIPNLIGLIRDDEGLDNKESRILKWTYVEKIRTAANDGSLANSKGLAPALVIWDAGGPRGEASAYVSKQMEKDEDLLIILRAFVLEPYALLFDYLSVEVLWRFVDINELYERIGKIDRTKLSEEDASVISSYEWQFEELGREE